MKDSMPSPLGQSVEALHGVGPGLAARLERLGVRTVGDLLWLIPLRYEDRTEVRPLGSLRPGDRVGRGRLRQEAAFGERPDGELAVVGEYGEYSPLRHLHPVLVQQAMEPFREQLIRSLQQVREVAVEELGAHDASVPDLRVVGWDELGTRPTFPGTDSPESERCSIATVRPPTGIHPRFCAGEISALLSVKIRSRSKTGSSPTSFVLVC